ncbi:F0F1 ATP synthase subunit A [Lacibacterium aquatile]|uniref:ATP synthase subunit a n=1 Tax=Lacibacterium aquatile TaxID=1168082 RepID=A0ABW5DZU8_9PROT
MAAGHSPLEQFEIKKLVDLNIGGIDISFNNSAAWMMIAVVLIATLMLVAGSRRAMVPGRVQSMAEVLYGFVADLVRQNAGKQGMKYFPFVFSIFMFVLFGNLLGMLPYSFTFTSHIIVTFALAISIFIMVTIIALARHGLHFFSFFLPAGVPLWLAPLMIVIEVISYCVRPISLSVRLFVNMMAGHTMLKVFAGFAISLPIFASPLPVVMMSALTALEILVCLLQAYVFSVLTCLYLKDAIELH